MATFGSKKFWKPAFGASPMQRESQIQKNKGYVTLQLYCVNYNSEGNFWQRTFGGKDKIALATTLKYQDGVKEIEATAVQDVREVRSNRSYNLGIQRNIATKIPATANAISLNVKMTAVGNDMLQTKFDMLNGPEYKSALELAPGIVGQVLTVTSLVKKLFTDSNPNNQLEADFAGTISSQPDDYPIKNNKLTKGSLIIISADDHQTFDNASESDFEIKGDALFYKGKAVENTYVIFNISHDQYKGEDENSNWSKKYREAINNLDKLVLANSNEEKEKLFLDSKNLWIEGNALLEADPTFTLEEKTKLKNLAFTNISLQYKQHDASAIPPVQFAEVLTNISGSASFNDITIALPATGSFMRETINPQPDDVFTSLPLRSLTTQTDKIVSTLQKDASDYAKILNNSNLRSPISSSL